MSKDEEKAVKGLEILGAVAGALLILAAIGAFLFENVTPHLMALAVGCGIIVNAVLLVLGFHKRQVVRGVIFALITLLLIAVFIMQIMTLKN